MRPIFTNSTVRWKEVEIERREGLIREIPAILAEVWKKLDPRVWFRRTETPRILPASVLQSHIDAGFELIPAGEGRFLRPETTIGTFESFRQDFPMLQKQLKQFREGGRLPTYLPACFWQAGPSFRDEKNAETMRATKLRLSDFWQQEFQLFCLPGTKADYIGTALTALTARWGGVAVEASDLPHYSIRTVDWMIDDLEVAGCSIRTDFEGLEVHEVAIGLDRLINLI